MKNAIDLKVCKVSLLGDRLVKAQMKDVQTLTYEDSQKIYDAIGSLGEGKKAYVVVVFPHSVPKTERKAQENAASLQAKNNVAAAAYVINSIGYRIMWKFFMNFVKQVIPRKVFESEKKAIEWLTKMRDRS